MSAKMKLGWWEDGNGTRWNIVKRNKHHSTWISEAGRFWFKGGLFNDDGIESKFDLIRYLGPIELSPTSACADQAGTPVVSPVSTETDGEQLQRMRDRFLALQREFRIYSALLPELERAMSDLEERIKAMEKEVEG